MNNNPKIPDSSEFCEKAAFFSLLAPVGSVIICFLISYISENHFSKSTTHLLGRYVFGAILVVQIISLIMGLIGLGGNGSGVKGAAIIGMILSCIVGFIAGMGLIISFSGMGWSDG